MSSRVFLDITPLKRFPAYRRLWFGYVIRQFGAQLTVTTVIYQVFHLTHSNLAVGLISAAQVGPGVLAPMIGGSIADSMDRRKLLLITAVAMGLSATVLAINSIGNHPALWVLYVMSAATWGLNGIDTPSRRAVVVSLVGKESIAAANALQQGLTQFAYIAGPASAGVLIGIFSHNIDIVYWIDVASTLAAFQAVARLPKMVPEGGGTKFGLKSIIEGFQFLRTRRVIAAGYITDISANVLGLPTALYPYMAVVHFHGGPKTFGLLTSAPAAGAILGVAMSGWLGRVRHQGRAVLFAVTVWGLAIACFGVAPWLGLGLVMLALAGWGDVVSATLRNTIIQTEAPDALRGRLSSISTATVQAGKLGNLEAGLVASVSSAQISIVSGGLGCVLCVLLIRRFVPSYARYQLYSSTREDHEAAPDASPDATPSPGGL